MIARLMDLLPRPLDRVRWIKLKLAILLVGSGLAGLTVFSYGIGWPPLRTSLAAIVVALVTSQILAHGITSPLREMTTAARAMARGDYTRRIRATSRDEVGQLAEAFNQMAADLAAADRQRRELIGNVSHELRTPITAVQATLENVVDGVADPDTLKVALAQTERLSRLIVELLDLSRLEAGALPLDRAELPLRELLEDVVAGARVAAAAAGSDVRFRVMAPTDANVWADRERLYQVLSNLVDNAGRHSPPGGWIVVSGRADAQGCVVDVADDGPGIPRAERHRVFERFNRGERAADGGTGLGLAIARWVVDLHGGTIAVVDTRVGCRIRVSLPASEGDR